MKNRKFVLGLDGSGAAEMRKGVLEYQDWLKRKSEVLAERLASIGATHASLGFSRAAYTGPRDHEIKVEKRGESKWAVIADGVEVLFVEFGAGIRYGYGHPEAGTYHMGPGTYPGKGRWDSPSGWYTPDKEHTFGNPPYAPMYNSVKTLEKELADIVREVFSGD